MYWAYLQSASAALQEPAESRPTAASKRHKPALLEWQYLFCTVAAQPAEEQLCYPAIGCKATLAIMQTPLVCQLLAMIPALSHGWFWSMRALMSIAVIQM